MQWHIDSTGQGKPRIYPVQEMERPASLLIADVIEPLAAMYPDARVGALLTKGVNPKNVHQEATVVCPNHKSSTEHHVLVGKAHREENEAGRNKFLRPSKSFRLW